MRAFLAVNIPDKLKRALSPVVQRAGSRHRAKWVRPKNLHFTLRFLGELSDEEVTRAVKALSSVTAPSLFGLSLGEAGAFGRPPRVLFYRVDEGKEELVELARRVNKALMPHFGPTDDFVPHLTVARARRGARVDAAWLPPPPGGSVEIGSFELMKSVLSPAGPAYSVVERFPLAGG